MRKEREEDRMDTLEREQFITDVQTIITSLAQLRRLDSATMQSSESITVFHQTLEAAYAAYRRTEMMVDELGQQLEMEHMRLDAAIVQGEAGLEFPG